MRSFLTPGQIAAHDAPLVGRALELEGILSTLHHVVATGRGRLVVLTGEAGVGKTRLARESLVRAHAFGIPGFLGRCFEQQTMVPFFAWTEPLAAAIAAASPQLQAELRSSWPELRHIAPDQGARPRRRGQETQVQVFRAVVALLHALAAVSPVVLVLDDLHWADTTSLDLLLYLTRHLNDMPVLMLGTYRDAEVHRQHPLERTLRELIREREVEEINLARLSLAGTAELVQSRMAGDVVSDELVALVYERALGNPFFTEEVLAAFIEQGALSAVADGAPLATLVHLSVPRGIRAVVDERVGRLPTSAQDLLRLASVLGQEFDAHILLPASGQTDAEVFAGLDAALEARLLEERGGANGERFAFVHALIQQTLYEELSAHRRRRLHLRVGQTLEGLRSKRTVPAELAHHFLHGGDRVRAAAYAIRAGEAATGRYAHAEAAHHFAIGVEVLDELDEAARAAEVRCLLAAEWFDLSRLPEALAAYETALTWFEQHGDVSGEAYAHWGLGRLHLGRYDIGTAATHLDSALRVWLTERENADLARLLVDAVRAKVFAGDAPAGIQLAERAVELAERLGHADLIARALVGFVEAHAGDTLDRVLIELLVRAERLARAASDWRTLSRVFIDRAVNRMNIGELEIGLADGRSAVEAADRSGETERLAFALEAVGLDCAWMGAWDEGRTAARAGLTLDRRKEFKGVVVAPGVLAWMEGRFDDALHELAAASSDARQRHDVQGTVYALAQLADYTLQLGRAAEAEAPAREAAEVTRSSWPSMMGFLAPLAETLVCLRAADAEAVLLDAEQLIEQTGKVAAQPQLLRSRALLLMHGGLLSQAIEILQLSAAGARLQGSRIQLGRTLAVLSDAAREHGDYELAAQADAERAALVERIGPEVHGLSWTRGLSRTQNRGRARRRAYGSARPSTLSPREREIAALIAQGLTDRQIAERLVITEGTAGVHVSNILNKLGVHTRADISRWASQGASSRAPSDEKTQAAIRPPELAAAAGPTLSPRERQVAFLVAEGLTNRQIAERLIVAERTAAAHVEHIMAKLGFTSRTQIAVWAANRHLLPGAG